MEHLELSVHIHFGKSGPTTRKRRCDDTTKPGKTVEKGLSLKAIFTNYKQYKDESQHTEDQIYTSGVTPQKVSYFWPIFSANALYLR